MCIFELDDSVIEGLSLGLSYLFGVQLRRKYLLLLENISW